MKFVDVTYIAVMNEQETSFFKVVAERNSDLAKPDVAIKLKKCLSKYYREIRGGIF